MRKIAKALLPFLPSKLALRLVKLLASQAQRPAPMPHQQASLRQATRLQYGTNGRNVAWSWGEGPIVILVHGWNGRAAQLAPLAEAVSQRGFRCVAIDVTAHGDSAGKHPSWHHFIDDIAALSAALGGNIFAYVGHSAGGLTMMAARAIKGLRARRFVCICTPSHPFPPIRAVVEAIDPSPRVLDLYRKLIAEQFETTWSDLEAGRAFADVGSELLLFYDEKDRYIDHSEGDRIRSWCQHAVLRKTASYGHGKVLSAPELERAVTEFLLAPESQLTAPAVAAR